MTRSTKGWPRRACLTLAVDLLAACTYPLNAVYPFNAVSKALTVPRTYPAEEFFIGRKLKLAKAIEASDMSAFRQLAEGEDLAATGDKNMTLLWFAMLQKKFDAIKTIIQLGVDPDTQLAQGIGSTLDNALREKDLRFLKAMLDGGLPPNHKSPKHNLMLQRAIIKGNLEHLKLLVERGADVNQRDIIGGTALHEAVNSVQPEKAIYLFERGADATTNRTNGVSVAWSVHRAIERQAPGPVRSQFEALRTLMIKKGVKFPPDPPEVVREQMRSKGLKPAVPPGFSR